ncbi:MAG: malonyl-CoA decarboxylase [Burkholderiaceae bacterium]
MFERIKQARRNSRERVDLTQLLDLCRQLMTQRGEANSLAIASRAVELLSRLGDDGMTRLFEVLAGDFDPDPDEVLRRAEQYAADRSPDNLIRLSHAVEPPRQELFRRLNRTAGGTAVLVGMRARLLDRMKQDRGLAGVDADLQHLLTSWFNPGFLRLVQVDWRSPAALLERIIRHEAVHEIDGWNDLRRRLEPDRRCFAFFHPALPDEPLIFVEVALVAQMPAAIAPLLARELPEAGVDPGKFKVAVFYSISNCQPGLRGINLGNFLIKQVAEYLSREFPSLRTFCTLSPIPSFVGWLQRLEAIEAPHLKPAQRTRLGQALAGLRERHGRDAAALSKAVQEPKVADADRQALTALCAYYLSQHSASPNGDPVARFHLHNGARLERINFAADLSRKGLKQSLGLMVNYLYDLDEIEANHERFIDGQVSASRAVLGLL